MEHEQLWNAYWADRSDANRNAIVERYLPLLHRVSGAAQRRLPRHVQYGDLVGAASVALIRCVPTYQPERGTFGAWAAQKMGYAIVDYCRGEDHVPRKERLKKKPLRQLFSLNFLLDGANVSNKGEHAGHGLRENLDWLTELADTRTQGFEKVDEADAFKRLIRGLPKRTRTMFWLYYVEELRMKQVGEAVGLSESSVSVTISEALRQIESSMVGMN